MQTAPVPLEVACDESGYEGEKLVGGTTDVFAHASVRLTTESAASCTQELRRRIRSPATEYKAGHVLREKHRSVLKWLLGPSGPLPGNAHVFLVDKPFFLVGKVIDLVGLNQDPRGEAMAVTLHRKGRRTFGREPWDAFLESSNSLMRPKNRRGAPTSVDSFFRLVDELSPAGAQGEVGEIMELLRQARPRADSFRARLFQSPALPPALDPLIPAIVRAVVVWGDGATPVSIVHDKQNSLSEHRVAQLREMLRERGRSATIRLVESHLDPRVQIADFLAGVARKIASDELNGRGDAALTALLRPYVDPASIWGDDRSWSLIG